jgi:hypothetical protein
MVAPMSKKLAHQIKFSLPLNKILGLIAFGLAANFLKPALAIDEAFGANDFQMDCHQASDASSEPQYRFTIGPKLGGSQLYGVELRQLRTVVAGQLEESSCRQSVDKYHTNHCTRNRKFPLNDGQSIVQTFCNGLRNGFDLWFLEENGRYSQIEFESPNLKVNFDKSAIILNGFEYTKDVAQSFDERTQTFWSYTYCCVDINNYLHWKLEENNAKAKLIRFESENRTDGGERTKIFLDFGSNGVLDGFWER